MRIVIDMQGAQTNNLPRENGRYTLAFAQAIARQKRHHEVFLLLNGHFEDTIPIIREAFRDLLPPEHLRVWIGPNRGDGEHFPDPFSLRPLAELLREDFIARLAPDVVLLTSFFDGYMDPAVISIGDHHPPPPTACIFYDPTTFLSAGALDPDHAFLEHRRRQEELLGKITLCLGITESASSCSKGAEKLKISARQVVHIPLACERTFKPFKLTPSAKKSFLHPLGVNGKFLLCTGDADYRNHELKLVHAFAKLPANLLLTHQLVFAGKMPAQTVKLIRKTAEDCLLSEGRLVFTGAISDHDLQALFTLAETFVSSPIREGLGLSLREALSFGVVLIAPNTPKIREIVGFDDALFDPLDEDAIVATMIRALTERKFRSRSKRNALKRTKPFSWDDSAQATLRTFEGRFGSRQTKLKPPSHSTLLAQAARLMLPIPNTHLDILSETANTIAQNLSQSLVRQLFLDISELCHNDAGSGVQRVVRSYLHHLTLNPPEDFRVEPVYASATEGYRYAQRFMDRINGDSHSDTIDEPISYQRGDVFFVLDLQHYTQIAQRNFYYQLRRDGVTVKFLIYDLLPIEFESLFHDPKLSELHAELLRVISQTDGAICISDATRCAYRHWLNDHRIETPSHFTLDVVHIGADIEGSNPSKGMPSEGNSFLKKLRQRTTFLQVSTLEPRKAQKQVLGAFETLWSRGIDANLVFVGHSGWKTEALSEKLLKHPEIGDRLFWLKSISDEYLGKIYQASNCLIAPSLNEGFGLSLIEAARHKIPIIARDIPVFREVAGNAAYFFSGEENESLADAICNWIELNRQGKHPRPEGMSYLSWSESTEKLKIALTVNPYPKRQILVDISALTVSSVPPELDITVREILRQWLHLPPPGYRVQPIYASVEKGYRYALRFTTTLMGEPEVAPPQDEPIEFSPGDVFLSLGTPPDIQAFFKDFYGLLRSLGLRVEFLAQAPYGTEPFFGGGKAENGEYCPWLDTLISIDQTR